MEVYTAIDPVQEYLQNQRFSGKTIGLVPTMGALHEGHLSLLRACRSGNDVSVCSIFVNPAQFNNPEDLRLYPRQLDMDLSVLEQHGCDAVFLPDENEMYPTKPVLNINFGRLEEVMEGKFRPGHFNGVGIVVAKLFNIIAPDRAYFGQKDLQQFAVINQLVRDLSFSTELYREPIVREEDGLAMSSRNVRLNPGERKIAASLYASLRQGMEALKKGEEPLKVKAKCLEWLEKQGVVPEYYEIVDPETLEPLLNHFDRKSVALCVAGMVGSVRLIDNLIIEN